MAQIKKHKILGQVFTPKWIVSKILDYVGYAGKDLIGKYICEPACGDGVFLKEIVTRYVVVAKNNGINELEIIEHLETFIVGIEIDNEAYFSCLNNLNKLVSELLETDTKVNWRIYKGNTLYLHQEFKNYFDFVVGNPPYIRIHHLDIQTRAFLKRTFQFSVGTIDMYISFFEMAFLMTKSTGKIGYITPNSFLHNASYKAFRFFLQHRKQLKILVDFKSNKVFQGFSTYTAISIFDKGYTNDFFRYKELENGEIIEVNKIYFDRLSCQKWNISASKHEEFLNNLFQDKNTPLKDLFDIQYGFATLRDKIFISKTIKQVSDDIVLFNNYLIEKDILKKIVKGSRYKGKPEEIEHILFPYIYNGKKHKVIEEEYLRKQFPLAYAYLLSYKEELEERDLDKGATWYEFGRSQGVQTIHQEKIIINTLVNGEINFHKIDKDTMLYSGIFITKKSKNTPWNLIENVLSSEDFYKYIRITGKDFSGGYKSISTKYLKEYRINYQNHEALF